MAKHGGFPGMGGMNMGQLMKQAKQMQKDLEESQEKLSTQEFEATSGGGAVSVKVTGEKVLKELKIKEEVVDPEDVEMLQDLIISCINEAMRKADESAAASMGKFNMPGMF